jgi:hypothetical protein
MQLHNYTYLQISTLGPTTGPGCGEPGSHRQNVLTNTTECVGAGASASASASASAGASSSCA